MGGSEMDLKVARLELEFGSSEIVTGGEGNANGYTKLKLVKRGHRALVVPLRCGISFENSAGVDLVPSSVRLVEHLNYRYR